MQKTNKILSFLLTMCMLLSIALPLTANAATVTFSDVPSNHTYYEAITNLAAEGVLNGFEDGSFKPEDPVTRAQFTKIICVATGLGDMTYGDDQKAKFSDVALDHWAINYITTGYNSKVIKGYGDDKFGPEDSVLYEQAVKMAVCTLGYPETRAEREGGYPNGYIKIASDIKLLKDMVGCKMGEPLSRGAVSQLIDNMLDTKVYEENESGKGNNTSKTDAPTMRDQVSSKSKNVNGRVVAVHGTSIFYDEESECNRKQIEVELTNGDREYFGVENFSDFDPNAYLGRSVTIYYEEDNSADYYEATNIVLQRKKNYEVTINLDDIEDYSNRELEYYTEDDEDEPEEISIDSEICIIRNGAATGDSFKEVLDDALPLSGYITLVCSQNEEVADVAFVKTYETIFVGSKDTTNCKIYAYQDSSKSFTLDEDDRSKTITFTKDGKPAEFSNIAVNNVVSVSTSDDGKLIDVQISSVIKKGTVTDILANDRIKLDSGNTIYRFADSCKRDEQISAGAYLTLYLDAFGKIARYIISAEKAYTFGYLAALEDGTMTNPKVEVMVYKLAASNSTLQGTRYMLKDNVRIDDKVYSVSKNADEIVSYLERIAADSKINPTIAGKDPENADYAQPIRFTTSSNNVIDRILTVKSTGEFNVSINIKHHTSEPVDCAADRTNLGNYSISSSVPILIVPSDRTGGTYMTKSNAYFKKGESYYVQVVNVNSANQPQAIYVYGTASAGADASTEVLTEDNIPMMVTSASEAIHADGEARWCLKLLGVDGSTMEVYNDNREKTEDILNVKVGDVIRVAADSENLVDAIEILASAEDIVSGDAEGYIKFDGVKEDELDAPFRTILGAARSVYGNSVVVAPTFDAAASATEETYTYADGVKVYVIDTQATNDNRRVTESVFAEVIGYKQQSDNASKIMIYTEKGTLKSIIIFK